MNGSGMIEVRKKSGSVEKFDTKKLAGCIWRAVDVVSEDYTTAWELARAVEIYLRRKDTKDVTSSAILEMVLKAMRRVKLGEAAEVLELHTALRSIRRKMLRVNHGQGQITSWDKNWLVNVGKKIWGLSDSVARIIAGEIEVEILPASQERIITRDEVYAKLNERVAEFGLADAMPVKASDKSQAI